VFCVPPVREPPVFVPEVLPPVLEVPDRPDELLPSVRSSSSPMPSVSMSLPEPLWPLRPL
jgi:hypothetical protein